jgi:hypothetical protein
LPSGDYVPTPIALSGVALVEVIFPILFLKPQTKLVWAEIALMTNVIRVNSAVLEVHVLMILSSHITFVIQKKVKTIANANYVRIFFFDLVRYFTH